MIGAARFILAAVGLLLSQAGSAAAFGWLVEVPNFEGLEPPNLPAYLTRPTGAGRFPAVVILHGCSGLSSGPVRTADRLRIWGYVALVLDSLAPRGIDDACGLSVGQEIDAHAALHYLAQQEFVDRDRVAVLGYSLGGAAALSLAREGDIAEFDEKFRAAIAYYPGCYDTGAPMSVPTMILIGGADDWTPAAACSALTDRLQKSGTPIDLTVYPGAYHAFNFSQAGPGFRSHGHWLAYNEAAAKDAEEKLHGFLAAHLLKTPSDVPATK
jgi:dienelactone hydrolase